MERNIKKWKCSVHLSPHRHASHYMLSNPILSLQCGDALYNLGNSDNKKYEAPESKLTNLLPQEACEVGFNQGETLKLSTHL